MRLISAGFGFKVFLCTPKWEMMGAAILAARFIKGFTRNVHEHPAFATHYHYRFYVCYAAPVRFANSPTYLGERYRCSMFSYRTHPLNFPRPWSAGGPP